MTLTVIATAKAANANAYCTVAEADALLEARVNTDPWTTADATAKAVAIVCATARLETEEWEGSRTTSTQALAWPRAGVVDFEGWPISDIDTVPTTVKRACAELALALLATPTLLDRNALDQFESIAVPGVNLTTRFPSLAAAVLPTMVKRLLAPVRAGGAGGGVWLVRG